MPKELELFYRFCRGVVAICFKIALKTKVSGLENIPKKGGFILASNHVSNLDPMVLGVACPRPLSYMGKYELFRNRFFAWLLRHVGVFPVKRGEGDLGAIREAMRRVSSGKGLLMFPEGQRQSAGVESEPPRKGIGFLISKLNVPVVPAYVKGTAEALPKGAKKLHFSKVYVSFGKQILFERGLPYQNIAGIIMDNIRHLECEGSN